MRPDEPAEAKPEGEPAEEEPAGKEPGEAERTEEEREARRRELRRELGQEAAEEAAGTAVGAAAQAGSRRCSNAFGCDRGGGGTRGRTGDGPQFSGGGRSGGGCCDRCDGCDGPCDFFLVLRISTLLMVASALVPEVGGTAVVRAALRLYRSRLTRFTPRCPSTPSCSAYALAAVESLGPRRGLAAAARRVRDCGRPPTGR